MNPTVHDPRQAVSRWGRYDEAQEHHDAARACAQALTAEMDDPYPHGLKR